MSDKPQVHPLQNFWNSPPVNGAYNTAELPQEFHQGLLKNLSLQQVAKLGEKLTSTSAGLAGWRTLEHGVRRPGFELDLIIQRGSWIRIVEVKTRRNPSTTPDFELTSKWMNSRKIAALQRGARFLLHEFARHRVTVTSISCDLVAVDLRSSGRATAHRWPNVCAFNN